MWLDYKNTSDHNGVSKIQVYVQRLESSIRSICSSGSIHTMPSKWKATIARAENIQIALEARALKRHRSHPRDSDLASDSDDEGEISLDGESVCL